jgi:hypothetical protein
MGGWDVGVGVLIAGMHKLALWADAIFDLPGLS